MFTGIVEATATVAERIADGRDLRLRLESTVADDLEPGASVSVSGVCLTAEAVDPPAFEVFLAEETRERTYLDLLEPGDRVNVELPRPVDGRLDGHIVQGHVDATVPVRDRQRLGEDWRYAFDLPGDLARYVVQKGSIAVDGISLTVAALGADHFEAAIIPETRARTTLDEKAPGDPVHLEVDLIARYVERLLDAGHRPEAAADPPG